MNATPARKPKRRPRRSHKAGLPPGSLIHLGEKKTDEPRLSLVRYDAKALEEYEISSLEDLRPLEEGRTTWINVDGLHDVQFLERLGRAYGIHALTLEDVLNTDHRPKLEEFDDYLFIVAKMVVEAVKPVPLQAEQLSIVIGRGFVLSFQERPGDTFESVRKRLRENKGRIRRLGADYLAYTLLDSVVDAYFLTLESYGDLIENLEEELLVEATTEGLRRIHRLRREVLHFRKLVWPLREVLSGMQRGESRLIEEPTRIYLRDVYDHTIQVIDTVETYRDTIAGLLELHLSETSNRMNAVIKVLTIIATIFIPITFVAGVYGMNFRFMPELEWRWGYPMSLGIMGLIAATMVLYFWRKNWL